MTIPELPKKGEWQLFMDVHVKDKDGKHYVTLMQAMCHKMFDERSLYYWAATYSQQLDFNRLGEAARDTWYTYLKPVIAIQVVDYDTNRARGIKNPEDVPDTRVKRVKEYLLPEGQFIKHFKIKDEHSAQEIDFFHMIQIELPRADAKQRLFPRAAKEVVKEKVDTSFFKTFSEQDWFLSLLRHAQDYIPQLVDRLKADQRFPKGGFVEKMFDRLRYADWQVDAQSACLKEENKWRDGL